MSTKKIIGLVSILIGLVLLGYGIYGTIRMAEARKDIDTKTHYLPGDGIRDAVRGGLYSKVDEYKVPVTLCYIGAVVFLVGGAIILRYKSKK